MTLEKNQGTLKVGEQDVFSYQYGFGVTLPELERGGYTFGGWYASEDFSGDPVKAIGADEMGERTFWAKWTPNTYDVIYDLGSDHNGDMPPESIDLTPYESYTAGAGLVLPSADVMAWPDHDFAGWYDSATFENSPIVEISASDYGDVTLHARWASDACVLFFHEDGGVFATTPQTVYEFGDDGFLEGSTVALPTATDIVRNGCIFEGWYDNADFNGQPLESVELRRGNIDLFAKWTAVEYGIAYELNGGAWASGYAAPDRYSVVASDVRLPGATDVVRDGFVFDGWYADAALEGASVTAIPLGATGDLKLYASWREPTVPDPGPGTDPDPGPDGPLLEIVSLAIAELGDQAIGWDENSYARIELPASKVPTRAEDFVLEVPNGVEYEITKRADPAFRWMACSVEPMREGAGASTIWDIVLRRLAGPPAERNYVLEIVPMAEGGDGNGDGNGGGDGDGNGGGLTPGVPTPMPPSLDGSTDTPLPPAIVITTPSPDAVGDSLQATGDAAPRALAALGVGALLASLLCFAAYRRRTRA